MKGGLICLVAATLFVGQATPTTAVPGVAGSEASCQQSPCSRPAIVLWAWERPEDLSWLPPGYGVAYLAATIFVSESGITTRPRRAPLRLPRDRFIEAVVRIEAGDTRPESIAASATDELAALIVAFGARPRVSGVMVDFEALNSQRLLWTALLVGTAARLPTSIPLSATTLAWRCRPDQDISVPEGTLVVPMLFRMGADGPAIRRSAQLSGRLSNTACAHALGVSLDEPMVLAAVPHHLYVFSPVPWQRRHLVDVATMIP